MEMTRQQYEQKVNELKIWVHSKYPTMSANKVERFAKNIVNKKYSPTIVKTADEQETERKEKEAYLARQAKRKQLYNDNKDRIVPESKIQIGHAYKAMSNYGTMYYAVCTHFKEVEHFDNTAFQSDDRFFTTNEPRFNVRFEDGRVLTNQPYLSKMVAISPEEYEQAINC
jgi:hypothetical protein